MHYHSRSHVGVELRVTMYCNADASAAEDMHREYGSVGRVGLHGFTGGYSELFDR